MRMVGAFLPVYSAANKLRANLGTHPAAVGMFNGKMVPDQGGHRGAAKELDSAPATFKRADEIEKDLGGRIGPDTAQASPS
jgi:hypothetical protein